MKLNHGGRLFLVPLDLWYKYNVLASLHRQISRFASQKFAPDYGHALAFIVRMEGVAENGQTVTVHDTVHDTVKRPPPPPPAVQQPHTRARARNACEWSQQPFYELVLVSVCGGDLDFVMTSLLQLNNSGSESRFSPSQASRCRPDIRPIEPNANRKDVVQ